MVRNRDEGMMTDSLADRRREELDKAFVEGRTEELREPIIRLVTQHRRGKVVKFYDTVFGGYNAVWRLDFADGDSVCLRVPKPGSVAFSEEKTRVEVATFRYIADKTSIPVPRVYHWGTAKDNTTGLGPFIIMEYIKHDRNLGDVLVRELHDQLAEMRKNNTYNLKGYKPTKNMDFVYRYMASLCLQLSTLQMPKIGSLVPKGDSYELTNRPLTVDLNDLPNLGNIPKHILPPEDRTYASSHEWYSVLADRHVAHLLFQHNDAVESDDDCRDKFVARHLFRQLIQAKKAPLTAANTAAKSKREVFTFWCDDIRPHNVLVDEKLKVFGVIDWEWSYFAPPSFSSDPPWWLILNKPSFNIINFDSWCQRYRFQLDIFLKILEQEEHKLDGAKKWTFVAGELANMPLDVPQDKPLSTRMRENWHDGTFWVDYAARRAYSFEPIFWKQIDERFFGHNERGGYEDRLPLLQEHSKRRMEWLVNQKMKEDEDYRLVEWEADKAASYLRAVLSALR